MHCSTPAPRPPCGCTELTSSAFPIFAIISPILKRVLLCNVEKFWMCYPSGSRPIRLTSVPRHTSCAGRACTPPGCPTAAQHIVGQLTGPSFCSMLIWGMPESLQAQSASQCGHSEAMLAILLQLSIPVVQHALLPLLGYCPAGAG